VLTNIGISILNLDGATLIAGSNSTAFQILSTDCVATLPIGESCALRIQVPSTANGTTEQTVSAGALPAGATFADTVSGFNPNPTQSGGGVLTIRWDPNPEPMPCVAQQTFTPTNQGFADAIGIVPAFSGLDVGSLQISTDYPEIPTPTASCIVTLAVMASNNAAFAVSMNAGGSAQPRPEFGRRQHLRPCLRSNLQRHLPS